MSKSSTPSSPELSTFVHYCTTVAQQLGGHRFPLNADAKQLDELLDPNAIHYSLTRQVLFEVYAAHQLQNIRQPIEAYTVLDALGAIRGDLLDKRGDVDQIALIDQIGELTVAYFKLEQPTLNTPPPVRSKVLPLTKS